MNTKIHQKKNKGKNGDVSTVIIYSRYRNHQLSETTFKIHRRTPNKNIPP